MGAGKISLGTGKISLGIGRLYQTGKHPV